MENAYIDKHGFSTDDWNETRSRVAALPLGLSGMGLRKHSQTRYFAFWGAAARAVERFTMTSDMVLAHPLKISPESKQKNNHHILCDDCLINIKLSAQ